MAWTGNTLTFDVTTTANARNLEGMLPLQTGAASLVALARDGAGVSFRTETIKGVAYAIFTAEAGSYQADYDIDDVAPVITGLTATPHGDGTATVSWTTTEPATSQVDFGTDALILGTQVGSPALVTSHAVTLTGLTAETTYHFRATSADAAANSATEPDAGNAAASFTTPAAPTAPCLLATTVADFAGGSDDGGIMVAEAEGGELILAPTEGSNFDGPTLPPGWTSGPWATGGTALPSGGQLVADAAYAATVASYPSGHVLEFVATSRPRRVSMPVSASISTTAATGPSSAPRTTVRTSMPAPTTSRTSIWVPATWGPRTFIASSGRRAGWPTSSTAVRWPPPGSARPSTCGPSSATCTSAA